MLVIMTTFTIFCGELVRPLERQPFPISFMVGGDYWAPLLFRWRLHSLQGSLPFFDLFASSSSRKFSMVSFCMPSQNPGGLKNVCHNTRFLIKIFFFPAPSADAFPVSLAPSPFCWGGCVQGRNSHHSPKPHPSRVSLQVAWGPHTITPYLLPDARWIF